MWTRKKFLQERSADVPCLCTAAAGGHFLPCKCWRDCGVFSGDELISLLSSSLKSIN